MKRYFKVILKSSPYYDSIVKLVGEIDYQGAKSGWHTVCIEELENKELLFLGDELQEINYF